MGERKGQGTAVKELQADPQAKVWGGRGGSVFSAQAKFICARGRGPSTFYPISSPLAQVAVSLLKEKFVHKAEALLHGDLHTGSIMVTQEQS